jgi:hypothetical protein
MRKLLLSRNRLSRSPWSQLRSSKARARDEQNVLSHPLLGTQFVPKQRSWIFVRDPQFREKAGRVLDLYQRRFEGRRLRPDEYVICADEKSQLQALGRRHAVAAAGSRPCGSV